MLRTIVAITLGIILIGSVNASEKKRGTPFEIKEFRLGMSEEAVISRFDQSLRCEQSADIPSNKTCKIDFLRGDSESTMRTLANEPVMNYFFYFENEKLGRMVVWFNSFNTDFIASADYENIRDALTVKFGKPKILKKQFIHRKAEEETWEIATWRRQTQSIHLDQNMLAQGIIELKLDEDAYSKKEKEYFDRQKLKSAEDI